MNEIERKYLHLRMTMKDIQLNCYKIRALTGETKNLKEKMFDIETLANDIDLRIKEAIEREVLFGWIILFLWKYCTKLKNAAMRTILNTYAWEEAIFLFWGKTRAEQSENKSGRAPFLLLRAGVEIGSRF